MGDAVIELEHGIIERQTGIAAQPEDMLHVMRLQHAHHGFGAVSSGLTQCTSRPCAAPVPVRATGGTLRGVIL